MLNYQTLKGEKVIW